MRFLRYFFIILLAAALIWLVPSEKALGETAEEQPLGEINPIPMDQAAMDPVDPQYYLSDTLYEDPSLRVEISSGRAFDTDYLVLRVKIADPSQLRSHVEKSSDGNYGDRIASRLNAVLAITGDTHRTNKDGVKGKYVIRQQKEIMVTNWKDKGYFDILFIDSAGDLHVLKAPTREECDAFMESHDVINTFSFGPALVVDGVVQGRPADHSRRNDRANGVGWDKRAQRLSFAQTGPLEYMVVVTGGPDNPKCKGLTGEEFMEVIRSECEPQQVYNLDGGNAAWVVFKGQKINLFGRSLTAGKRRIEDMIYFASAWHAYPVAEPEESTESEEVGQP